jgi:hypothetical protein
MLHFFCTSCHLPPARSQSALLVKRNDDGESVVDGVPEPVGGAGGMPGVFGMLPPRGVPASISFFTCQPPALKNGRVAKHVGNPTSRLSCSDRLRSRASDLPMESGLKTHELRSGPRAIGAAITGESYTP